MADILSGPDGTTTTHSPRTTTHRPPNHARITPISSHMVGPTRACNPTLIIANQHTQPDMRAGSRLSRSISAGA